MKKFAWVIPMVLVAIFNLWVLGLEAAGRLPDPIATHWNIEGKADGFVDLGTHLAWSNFALLLSSGLLSLLLWYPKIHPSLRKLFMLLLGYFAVFMFGLMTYIIWIQIDVLDPSQIRLGIGFIWALLPIFIFVPMLLRKPQIEISEDLRIKIWGITFLRMGFSEIANVSEDFLKPAEFGGLGLRLSRGRVAFIPSQGPALRIESKNGEVVLVRSDNVAQQIAEISNKI